MTDPGAWLWVHMPLKVMRWSRTLAAVLVDGAYLRGTPAANLLVPVAAFGVGAGYALTRGVRAPTFTVSITAIVVFALISGFGAALGLWLTLGYALADQVSPAHEGALRYQSFSDQLAMRASWVLSALVLALLVVMIPLAVTATRAVVANLLRSQPPVALVASAVAAGLAALVGGFGWIQVSPVLIRPIYTWPDGGSPTVEAVAPMQTSGWKIVLAIVVAAVARTFVERLLSSRLTPLQVEAPVIAPPTTLRSVVTAVGSAATTTFLFSGVYAGFQYAAIALIGFLIAALLRHVVLPRARGYATLVSKIPLIVRLAVLVGVTYLAGRFFLSRAQSAHDETFTFILWTTLVASFVAAALLPVVGVRSRPSRPPVTAASAVVA